MIKKILFCLFFTVGLFFSFLPVLAGDYGLDATAREAGIAQKYESDATVLIGNLIGGILAFISVLFFALMIYGGIRWMLSRGNEDETKKALDTMIAAVIGIAIVLASYAITKFVFDNFNASGAPQTPAASAPPATPAP